MLRYAEEGNVSFTMPGHKNGAGFLSTREGRKLYENLFKIDITEVDGVDNLHHPEGIIREAQQLLSKFYESRKSYFLVNGSTSGNLAMIFSSFNEGDKIIVERNCHRSIFNGIIMRKLKPIYIKNKISKRYNAPISIDMEHFSCLLEQHKDAKGIIVTYPNYYGICSDLKTIISCARKYNMMVLVDSAHGAHFGVNEKLPESAVKLGADMVVMSSHKTLSSFTQTAYLHVGDNADIEKVDFYVSSFLSTSPSYMLMASMDYARYYLEEYGVQAYEDLIERANKYRYKFREFDFLKVLESDKSSYFNIDLSRFVINVKEGLSGYKLLDYLKSRGIQCEMSDGSNVVLIFSTFNSEKDFEKLYNAIKECNLETLREEGISLMETYIPETKLLPFEVIERKKVRVSLEEACGRICASSVVPYPPGVPILNLGEIIDNTSLNMIKYYLDYGVTVLGIENRKITVVE
nr:aminotransferase class I/II-fold pyridoxal phosphate-dependent enzyme [Clostridium swellfunianum]